MTHKQQTHPQGAYFCDADHARAVVVQGQGRVPQQGRAASIQAAHEAHCSFQAILACWKADTGCCNPAACILSACCDAADWHAGGHRHLGHEAARRT